MEEKKKKAPYLTKGSLILRILVAFYLLYTVNGLAGSLADSVGRDRLFIIIFMLLFGVIGVLLGIYSIKALIKKEYVVPREAAAEDVVIQEVIQEEDAAKVIETAEEIEKDKTEQEKTKIQE